jgi:hypothetical protein
VSVDRRSRPGRIDDFHQGDPAGGIAGKPLFDHLAPGRLLGILCRSLRLGLSIRAVRVDHGCKQNGEGVGIWLCLLVRDCSAPSWVSLCCAERRCAR